MATTITDAQIKRDVQDVLNNDVRVDATNVTVEVHNGEVHLTGFVGTYVQKLTAGTDAQRIKGVRGVRNDLVVTLARTYSDEEIAHTIRSNLARDARLSDAQTLSVVAHRGVVTLGGEVGGRDQRDAAVDDAWTAPGVVDVVDEIKVPPSS